MRSKPLTVKLPWPLYEALQHICTTQHFENMHACVLGACIRMVQDNRRHKWITAIANSAPKQQDFLLEKLFSFPLEDANEMVRVLKKLDS